MLRRLLFFAGKAKRVLVGCGSGRLRNGGRDGGACGELVKGVDSVEKGFGWRGSCSEILLVSGGIGGLDGRIAVKPSGAVLVLQSRTQHGVF